MVAFWLGATVPGKGVAMRYGSVCSGIEAASVAWRPLRWECAFVSEIDPFPAAVLKERFPEVKNLGDFSKIQPHDFEGKIDLLVGGTPCFTAGNLVLTESGYKKIEEIKVGDRVVTHLGRLRCVSAIGNKMADNVCKVKVCGRPSFKVTANHPFFVKSCQDGGEPEWKPIGECEGMFAAMLRSYSAVKNPKNNAVGLWRFPKIESVEPTGVAERVYNLEVEGDHTYIANGCCVHNCQAFSIAGLRKGLQDERGNLALEFAKLAFRLTPRWVVWENVPGVLSSGGGRDFASFLSLLVGWEVPVPVGGWRKSGLVNAAPGGDCYSVGWRVLDAQYTRVPEFRGAIPQRRKRVILVGYLGPWTRPAKVLFDGELCGGDTPPRREKGLQAAGTVREGAQVPRDTRQELTWWDGADVSPTFTPRSIGQTMPDKGQLPCILDRRWLSDSENGGASPTILSTDYKEPKAVITGEPLCYPLDLMNIDGRDKMDYITIHGEEGGSAYPITRRRPSGVCTDANGPIPLVRKLMPVEAERLMGFPSVIKGDVSAMTKDEYIVWLLMTNRIQVNCETGEVFSLRTGGGNPCPPRRLRGTLLQGYRVVSLREKDVKKQCRVHRIVWTAKHGIIPEGYVIDHINNNRQDNRIENLQLLTPAENSTKAAADGCYRTGEDHPGTKISKEESEWIVGDYRNGVGTMRELAAKYGISKSRVCQLVHSEEWTQIPWRGKPAEECPEGHRYKALGNSMCVNVMSWIGHRIDETEKELQNGSDESGRGDGETSPPAEGDRG